MVVVVLVEIRYIYLQHPVVLIFCHKRIFYDNIQIEFGGQNDPEGGANILHSAYHAITEGFPIIYDDYCHMVVVLDHTNNFITTYINGVLNASTDALITVTTQEELDIGKFYGNGATTVPFFINKYALIVKHPHQK